MDKTRNIKMSFTMDDIDLLDYIVLSG